MIGQRLSNLPMSTGASRFFEDSLQRTRVAGGERTARLAAPVMSTTLPLFWHLSSASKKERLDASVKLVAALEHFQSNFVPKESPETSEDEDEDEGGDNKKSDGLDALNAQDVSYSLRRLIRGLASPRESSRLGFAVALTEVRI